MKKHLKRLPAARSLRISRKTHIWAVKSSPGPHPLDRSIPLLTLLRDFLHLVDNAREGVALLTAGEVLVDGRVVRSSKFPVGLMDVVSLPGRKEHYRILLDHLGRLAPAAIESSEAGWKLCRVEGKTTLRGGITQLNLHDGRNLLVKKDDLPTGTTLKLQLPKQTVAASFPQVSGNLALLIGGQHAGEVGHLDQVLESRNPRANVARFREGFDTIVDYVFIIGKEAPEIRLPESPAVVP
jgi:small subunit ribosomal protein S4e